ncbi:MULTISPECIES: thiamine phosphate synthase [unclassified Hyphomicrobium]|uniref:thiamine phosphate synthase n=1 Tax=unclassified Hyphomicrobium TaxID=2619925 RepID=UPI000213E3AE|nr:MULTISPECIES: thiamine phosphate synthase [unclassified Hyphomicrobium]CCB63967.1 Thiamine-phosphate pyrophosphorylase [Hyphomicrobium sp. MC1]
MILDRFYPIVPDVGWLERIVPLGVTFVQLRIKDASAADIAAQAKRANAFCKERSCTLVLNDYWEAALDAGVGFIHLGQDDLRDADLEAIKLAGIKLGISTHDIVELDNALAAEPDYVALGPIYETKLKAMAWAPQGLDKIKEWRRRIGALPLVAIGGLTPERAAGVLEAGADSLAVITDFFTAPDPEARIKLWLRQLQTR